MIEYSNPELSQIMSIASNQQCVDCLAQNPTFTSINNAVFLCSNCANAHRALGKNISEVKSLTNDQFSPEEISLLKIGGNARFNTLMGDYGITSDQNKEFKYHLNLADYYRKLLLAELTKEQNPNAYETLLNNKPNPEVGLQIMESVTVESIKQAKQEPQSEFAKDASNFVGKMIGFFNSVENAINQTAEKYGVNQKINEMSQKIGQGVKNFGENHPTINNAANSTLEALKQAGQYVGEATNKIINSETVKNATQSVNNKYNEIMNSETMKNLSKKAEENYISLKNKAIETFGSNNNAQPNQPQENNEQVPPQMPNQPQENNEQVPPQVPNQPQENNEQVPPQI